MISKIVHSDIIYWIPHLWIAIDRIQEILLARSPHKEVFPEQCSSVLLRMSNRKHYANFRIPPADADQLQPHLVRTDDW